MGFIFDMIARNKSLNRREKHTLIKLDTSGTLLKFVQNDLENIYSLKNYPNKYKVS